MHFNKKGDLAISTNAIVVLIIAVIMLGLIIGFVTQGFGAVSDKFFGEIEKMPEPAVPSASKPITFSEVMVAHQGKEFGMKISVYNTGASALTNVEPRITGCSIFAADSENANPQTIQPNDYGTFIYVNKIADNAETGKQLCSVTTSPASNSADLIIEVRE